MLGAPWLALVDGALDPERDINGAAGHRTLTVPATLTGEPNPALGLTS